MDAMMPDEEVSELRSLRDQWLLRKAAALRDLEARVARDDALHQELERQTRQMAISEMAYAKHQTSSAFLRFDVVENLFRNVTLRQRHYGDPHLQPEPPREIPADLRSRFTLDGRIALREYFEDRTYPDNHPLIYTDA
jgi:hypothetical protein